MSSINTRLFTASEQPLVLYNGQAILDKQFRFYTIENCEEYTEVDFNFPDYAGSYFRAYNERSGRLIVDIALSRDTTYLIMNASESDISFEDNGNYYYEIGYVRGVYEQVLRFGTLQVI